MTKKPIIACFAVLGMLLMAELLLFSGTKKAIIPGNAISAAELSSAYFNTLNFANETLPVNDAYVFNRVKKALNNFGYENLQTYRLHRQASRWFPIMEPILARYGIPEDFKYVPLVESGLKSGTSPRGASGLWQFMPHTARAFGLKVNQSVDERHQIEKSTIAACKYLRSLHKEFKNWTLVAAAYNVGENKLKRLINDQEQVNYFSIRLNRETAGYVYKLVAMKEIIEHPDVYGYDKISSSSLAINNRDTRYYPENFFKGLIHTTTQLD
ncbi:MAG: lytic transglycosylase domain-containing protein [Sphingobacteriaceae bacterium]